jgi:hypothetical protein
MGIHKHDTIFILYGITLGWYPILIQIICTHVIFPSHLLNIPFLFLKVWLFLQFVLTFLPLFVWFQTCSHSFLIFFLCSTTYHHSIDYSVKLLQYPELPSAEFTLFPILYSVLLMSFSLLSVISSEFSKIA